MGRVYAEEGLVLTNDSGGTSIDEKGVVSTQNFSFGGTTAPAGTTTSSTFTPITGGTMTFSLDRTANVLLLATGFFVKDGEDTDNAVYIEFAINGTNSNAWSGFGGGVPDGYIARGGYAVHTIKEIGSGTGTAILQWKVSGGTASLGSSSMSYLVLGK